MNEISFVLDRESFLELSMKTLSSDINCSFKDRNVGNTYLDMDIYTYVFAKCKCNCKNKYGHILQCMVLRDERLHVQILDSRIFAITTFQQRHSIN